MSLMVAVSALSPWVLLLVITVPSTAVERLRQNNRSHCPFELSGPCARMAQLVEQLICNQQVAVGRELLTNFHFLAVFILFYNLPWCQWLVSLKTDGHYF